MKFKALLIGGSALLAQHTVALAQIPAEVVGWWASPRNEYTLELMEIGRDGTMTLGECFRTKYTSRVCAGRPVVQDTAKMSISGDQQTVRDASGKTTISTYSITRPDPRDNLKLMKLLSAPNNYDVWFEMPRTPERWCPQLPCK
jgi:hypothetical protein